MAKKQSLFDDKPKEIEEYTYLIKQDINNLQSELLQLQNVRIIENFTLRCFFIIYKLKLCESFALI